MKTTFPVPLGEAASFDPGLAERTARAAAIEATAKGIHWTFAPMVDVARDQRWGRVVEGSGEDPWLGVQFAKARVRGFQGASLKDDTSMLACPKHFAAYGAVQGGMEYNTADIPDTTLREVHLPGFKAAFDAGALSTMSSFNDIAGVPSTANHYLLTDILRGEWGFKGLVVSDYTSEEELILHGYAADGPDAVVKALTAGLRHLDAVGALLEASARSGESGPGADGGGRYRGAARAVGQEGAGAVRQSLPLARPGARGSATCAGPTRSRWRARRRASRWCCSRTKAICCRWRRRARSR